MEYRAIATRADAIPLADEGFGYDAFGASRDGVRFAAELLAPLYDRWFRVESHGSEHIPATGPAILVSNHSGTLPFDGGMIWLDVLRRTNPPRIVRPVLDHFVNGQAFIGTMFARAGAIAGSRKNVATILEAGEPALIFPEGTTGIGKSFRDRYRLQAWRVGHTELALRHGVPIIPLAVIGAEEQMPSLAKITIGAKALGVPWVPIPVTPFPLPVHYRIEYGEPIAPAHGPEAADDPRAQHALAELSRLAVERLIERGLRARRGVFR